MAGKPTKDKHPSGTDEPELDLTAESAIERLFAGAADPAADAAPPPADAPEK